MASAPRISEPGAGEFGPRLAERVRPRLITGRRRLTGWAPGRVGRQAISFTRAVGLSQMARWSIQHQPGVGIGRLPARPPLHEWPWSDDDPGFGSAPARARAAVPPAARETPESLGDPKVDALRRLIGQRSRPRTRPVPPVPARSTRPPRRGLPTTVRRRGTTKAGSGTAPGQIGRRLRPEMIDAPSSPAVAARTSPTVSARLPARPGVRSSPGRTRPTTDTTSAVASRWPADDSSSPATARSPANPASTVGSSSSTNPSSPLGPATTRWPAHPSPPADSSSPTSTRWPARPSPPVDPSSPTSPRWPASPGSPVDPSSLGRTLGPVSPGFPVDPSSPGRTRAPADPRSPVDSSTPTSAGPPGTRPPGTRSPATPGSPADSPSPTGTRPPGTAWPASPGSPAVRPPTGPRFPASWDDVAALRRAVMSRRTLPSTTPALGSSQPGSSQPVDPGRQPDAGSPATTRPSTTDSGRTSTGSTAPAGSSRDPGTARSMPDPSRVSGNSWPKGALERDFATPVVQRARPGADGPPDASAASTPAAATPEPDRRPESGNSFGKTVAHDRLTEPVAEKPSPGEAGPLLRALPVAPPAAGRNSGNWFGKTTAHGGLAEPVAENRPSRETSAAAEPAPAATAPAAGSAPDSGNWFGKTVAHDTLAEPVAENPPPGAVGPLVRTGGFPVIPPAAVLRSESPARRTEQQLPGTSRPGERIEAGSTGIRRRPRRQPLPLALGEHPPSSTVPDRLLPRLTATASNGALVRLPRGLGLAWRSATPGESAVAEPTGARPAGRVGAGQRLIVRAPAAAVARAPVPAPDSSGVSTPPTFARAVRTSLAANQASLRRTVDSNVVAMARPGVLGRSLLVGATERPRKPDAARASRRSIVAPGPGVLERTIRRRESSDGSAEPFRSSPSPAGHPTAELRGAGAPNDARAAARPAMSPRDRTFQRSVVRADRPMPPLARDFLVELGRHRREEPRALPVQFRPIANEVVGPRRVMVSSDPASRRALRRVGKVAATTDDVIHLNRAPTAASPELIAHELAHIAHPSPTPRFFADPVRGPEERQAEAIARVMRAAPVLPRVAGAGDADRASSAISGAAATTRTRPTTSSGPTRPATTVQRSTSSGPTRPTTTASDLAARLTGTASPVVQRRDVRAPVAPTLDVAGLPGAPPLAAGSPESPPPTFSGVNTTDSLDQFQRLVEMLEERIIVELERRGGRFRGGF